MFIHTTISKVKPENVKEAVAILSSERNQSYFLTLKGFQHGYVIESFEEAGKLVSLSFWDSQADAQAVFADPNYAALLADLRSLLIASPGRLGYQLLTEFHRA
jgi:heme-degrading monooxygenase HmoA